MMINLQWGTQKNGQIDTALLVDVSGKGDYLEPTAAAQWKRMRNDLHAALGAWIDPAPGSSAYRPVSIQEQFWNAYVAYLNGGPYAAVAAQPVTRGGQGSNHGWGRAIDITGYESRPDVWAWLIAHAGEYGYSWATGEASGERWHWESLTPPGTTVAALEATKLSDPEEEDDDMKVIYRQKNGVNYILGQEYIKRTFDKYATETGTRVNGPAIQLNEVDFYRAINNAGIPFSKFEEADKDVKGGWSAQRGVFTEEPFPKV